MDNELKEIAKYMRECADIIDEIIKYKDEDEDKKEELTGRFFVKFAKLIAAINK